MYIWQKIHNYQNEIRMKKKLNLLLLSLISIMAFTSCTGNKKTANTDTMPTILTIDKIMEIAEQEVGNIVVIEGFCTHICSHGGKKLFLMGSHDSTIIRVESNNAIGAFKSECENSIVQVKGTLREERIDEAYIAKIETDIAEGTAENHGDGEEGGCETEQKAEGIDTVTDEAGRIENFKARIAKRMETEGKNYLSFYYIEAEEYTIL